MKYGLKLLPQGAIARDIGIKVKLQPAIVGGGDAAGKCVKAFAGYAVNGAATYNPIETAADVAPTWNWPCNGSAWSITVTGFGIPCGGVYSWSHTIVNDVTLSSHLTFTEGADTLGNPTLQIDGDSDTCLNVGEILQVSLALDGDTSFGSLIDFRKQPDAITVTFLGAIQTGANWSYGWDGLTLTIAVRDPGAADYQFMFQATGAESGSVDWFYDLGPGGDPDTTINVIPGPGNITFDVNYTGAGVGMPVSIYFYCQDSVIPTQTAPSGAPGIRFHIAG